jgi:DNA-binding Xre family transcriptional regulator
LEKVCCALNCNIEDVLEFIKVSEVFPHDHS